MYRANENSLFFDALLSQLSKESLNAKLRKIILASIVIIIAIAQPRILHFN